MDDAFGVGVAGVGKAVPTGPLWLTAAPLVPNIAGLAGPTPEGALAAPAETHPSQRGGRATGGWLDPGSAALTGVFMQTEFSTQPPPLFLHSSISSHTWRIQRKKLSIRSARVFVLDYRLVGVIKDLFVGSGISQAQALDLGPAVARRTGTTAETRGRVDAAHAHVAGLDGTLVHIGAVCTVALHPVRTGTALNPLRGHPTLRPRVAGVRHAGGPGLHPPHP